MSVAANILVALVGLKTFKMTREKAEITAVLAANQGLYSGFLAAGLLASFAYSDPVSHALPAALALIANSLL